MDRIAIVLFVVIHSAFIFLFYLSLEPSLSSSTQCKAHLFPYVVLKIGKIKKVD